MRYIYPLIMFTMLLRCSSGQQDSKRYHLSPHQAGLVPASPLEVPIPDLKEPAPSINDPLPEVHNITYLLKELGSNFDPNIMSIDHPGYKDDNSSYFGYRRSHLGRLIPTGIMPEYLNKIDFKHFTLPNGSKLKTRISPKLKRKIQQFLWAHTACPIVYHWKDLGVKFWPRYLKIGACSTIVSCSIPPGMTCQQSKFAYKKVLYWRCKSYQHKICHWIKISYPVLTECSCSCPNPQSSDN